jgi:hypothetical protein
MRLMGHLCHNTNTWGCLTECVWCFTAPGGDGISNSDSKSSSDSNRGVAPLESPFLLDSGCAPGPRGPSRTMTVYGPSFRGATGEGGWHKAGDGWHKYSTRACCQWWRQCVDSPSLNGVQPLVRFKKGECSGQEEQVQWHSCRLGRNDVYQ